MMHMQLHLHAPETNGATGQTGQTAGATGETGRTGVTGVIVTGVIVTGVIVLLKNTTRLYRLPPATYLFHVNCMANSRLYCALGYACNNNCLLCVVDSKKKANANLATEDIVNYLKVLDIETDIKKIEFSGGEPTIRNDFLYILDWVHQRRPNLRYTIFSNGRRFCDVDFANKMADYPIADIIIAIHGKDAKTHDHLTQREGSFNETLIGIRNLSEIGINLILKIIPTKLNYKQIPDIVRLIISSFPDVKTISFNGIDIRGCALENADKICARFTDVIPYIQEGISIANKHGLKAYTYSIPQCLLDVDFRKQVGVQKNTGYKYKSPFHDINDKNDEYGRGNFCGDCRAKEDCAGCWKSYLDFFGSDELKPIGRAKGIESPSKKQQPHVIDITGDCNNNCLFCLYGGKRDTNIPLSDIKKAIDNLFLNKNEPLVLSGGEPAIRDDLIQIVDYGNSKGYSVSITSNGRMFKEKCFSEQLSKSGAKSVIICLHAATPELHDAITQSEGSFDETIYGIRNLLDSNICVVIKIMVNKLNYKNLEDIVDYIAQNIPNVNSIVFASLNITGSASINKDRIIVRLKDSVPYIQKAIDLASARGIRSNLDMYPYCVFDQKYHHFIHSREYDGVLTPRKNDESAFDATSGQKPVFSFCRGCKFSGKCPAFWSRYVEIYGEEEFKCIR